MPGCRLPNAVQSLPETGDGRSPDKATQILLIANTFHGDKRQDEPLVDATSHMQQGRPHVIGKNDSDETHEQGAYENPAYGQPGKYTFTPAVSVVAEEKAQGHKGKDLTRAITNGKGGKGKPERPEKSPVIKESGVVTPQLANVGKTGRKHIWRAYLHCPKMSSSDAAEAIFPLPSPRMAGYIFNMRYSLTNKPSANTGAFEVLPRIDGQPVSGGVPVDEDCFALWRKYGMLENVKRHSILVAHIATRLASDLFGLGFSVDCPAVRASALLHDIAKTYCLQHGGGHAQLGAAWVVTETRNYAIAQGVFLHVWWPWPVPSGPEVAALPLLVLYADKRARHDSCVTLEERYDDLMQRYGTCSGARESITASRAQAREIEVNLSALLGRDIHEDTFDSGRLVQRA